VRVDQLRAHLEVYVDTIPAITALRLCNRFGTGDDCHINKLPIELVGLIEEHIVEPERESGLEYWNRTLKCCEGNCEPLDHYDEEELSRLYHSTFGCRNDGCETGRPQIGILDECYHRECKGDKCPAWKYDRHLNRKMRKQLEELPDITYKDFSSLCEIWRMDCGPDLDADGDFFKKNRELLKTHFGISVWTGRLRPMGMNDTDHTTTAYLTLPKSTMRHEKWECEYFNDENIGYGMPVNIGAPPTEHSLLRFPRALKILGLQAWTHPSLEGRSILSPPSVDTLESKTTDKAAMQPQLTFLVRNNIERHW
jgi:hypothetical protein